MQNYKLNSIQKTSFLLFYFLDRLSRTQSNQIASVVRVTPIAHILFFFCFQDAEMFSITLINKIKLAEIN